jgi:very-short-patch-repair endonuclease
MLLQEIKGSGEKNSQFGTKWVHRGVENKKVADADLQQHLDAGWEIGRRIKAELAPRKKYRTVCSKCDAEFESKRNDRSLCNACTKIAAGNKGGETMRERGSHAGWHNRKGERSYPERYFEDVFDKEGINGWQPDKKVGRWFIDFAFSDKMIAVEIDGRQHKIQDRAESDKLKDEYLRSQGWKVIRIDWFNPRTQSGKDRLHPQVKALLDVLR